MDRPIIYSLEQIRSFDILNGWRDALVGCAYDTRLMLGQYESVVSGFVWSQTTSPSLTVNMTEGFIAQLNEVDLTEWGDLATDTQLIEQIGYYPGGQIVFTTAGLSAGHSQWALVEITWQQSDVVRALDPTNGVLPYVNVQNLGQPLEGPNNSGAQQPTERQSNAVIAIKYGTPATSSPVAPAPDAGYVPLALIQLTAGQTAITTGEIVLAGPNAYSGYQNAPYFPGVTGQIPGATSGSHHGGIAGQASQIDVTSEIVNVVPYLNLPVSNTSPPGIAGIVTVAGDIPIISQGTSNPNGNLAGNLNDMFFYLTTGQWYICTTSGSSSTAVWSGVGAGGQSSLVNTSGFAILPGNYCYLVDTSGGDITATMPLAASMGGTGAAFVNIGANRCILSPATGERFGQNPINQTYVIPSFAGANFAPRSSYGFYFRD